MIIQFHQEEWLVWKLKAGPIWVSLWVFFKGSSVDGTCCLRLCHLVGNVGKRCTMLHWSQHISSASLVQFVGSRLRFGPQLTQRPSRQGTMQRLQTWATTNSNPNLSLEPSSCIREAEEYTMNAAAMIQKGSSRTIGGSETDW